MGRSVGRSVGSTIRRNSSCPRGGLGTTSEPKRSTSVFRCGFFFRWAPHATWYKRFLAVSTFTCRVTNTSLLRRKWKIAILARDIELSRRKKVFLYPPFFSFHGCQLTRPAWVLKGSAERELKLKTLACRIKSSKGICKVAQEKAHNFKPVKARYFFSSIGLFFPSPLQMRMGTWLKEKTLNAQAGGISFLSS